MNVTTKHRRSLAEWHQDAVEHAMLVAMGYLPPTPPPKPTCRNCGGEIVPGDLYFTRDDGGGPGSFSYDVHERCEAPERPKVMT